MNAPDNKKKGWVPFYRSILDNPLIMKDADHLALWSLLLLLANHEQRQELLGGRQVTVNGGQFTTGRRQLAQRVNNGFSESKVERMLNAFETAQQIEQQKTTTNRLITILNWNNYKLGEQQNEQQVNNDRTTSEQRVNTLEEVKNVRSKEYTPPTPPRGERVTKDFEKFWEAYPRKISRKRALTVWKSKGLGKISEQIIEFVRKAKQTDQWQDMQYVPHPATFLNQERWTDDLSGYERESVGRDSIPSFSGKVVRTP